MDKDKIYKGYKATDENMCCRGFQFELGRWYSCEGELVLCENGFHFCEYPSGPWAYYSEGRLFEIEAKEVVQSEGPGADLKHVARHIRLVKEIKIDGDKNTGDLNTGYKNTGDLNTGYKNTGYKNTGYKNTGDLNTGNRNTGDLNTGDKNTGNRNTGDWNTGDWNTGIGNVGDYHSGCLCMEPAPFFLFDIPASRDQADFGLIHMLSDKLQYDEPFDTRPFLAIENATEERIKALHAAHIEARKELSR